MADKFKRRDDIVKEFKRESGGSFSTIYRAFKEASRHAEPSAEDGRKLDKNTVLEEIRNIRGTRAQE